MFIMFVKPYFLRNSAEDGNAEINISANIPFCSSKVENLSFEKVSFS